LDWGIGRKVAGVSASGARHIALVSRSLEIRMHPLAKAALLLAAIFALLALAVLIVKKYRSGEGEESTAGDMLARFRELHGQGELSDEEFRTIKKKLSAQLRAELKDTEGKG
jgi:hypothetical protein